MVRDQLGDRRSRHQHAFIDVKAQPAKPRFSRDIRGRLPRLHAQFQALDNLLAFGQRQHCVEIIIGKVRRQRERMQRQVAGLVQRRFESVTETQLLALELAGAPANQITDSCQNLQSFGNRHVVNTVSSNIMPRILHHNVNE